MSLLEIGSLIFTAVCIYRMIDTFGKKINIPETIAAITSLIYLFSPVIAYTVFNEKHRMARLWQTIMPISSDNYFSFALPAIVALTIGLFWPFDRRIGVADADLLKNVKTYLARKAILGYILFTIGIFSALVEPWVPDVFKAVSYFANQLVFIGILYLLFSPGKQNSWMLVIGFMILVLQSIYTGMYGEMVYWSFLIVVFLLLNRSHISNRLKGTVFIIGLLGIFFIQSIKHEYRLKTWTRGERGADAAYFFTLVSDRIRDPLSMFSTEQLFNMSTRGNQGFLLARTMDYVPKHEPFAKGETIIQAVQASIVPRFIWKDKPELGGTENTCRFLGDCGKRDYSYNIGQIGEAYVNFNSWGGMLYLFLYGLFISWGLYRLKKLALRIPSVLLWTPLLFFASLSLETDLLTFLNTLIKGMMFTLFVYLFFRLVFRWRI